MAGETCNPIVAPMTECPRCLGDHGDLEFRELAHVAGESTHWAPCPTTGEPILMTVLGRTKAAE